jgi:hypothetical protein
MRAHALDNARVDGNVHLRSWSIASTPGLAYDLEGPGGYFERPKYFRSGGGWSFLDGISLPSTLI